MRGGERRSGQVGGYTPSPMVDRRKRPWAGRLQERRVAARAITGPDRRRIDPWGGVRERED